MICVSIAEPTPEACLRAIKGIGFAEIRIDKITGIRADDIQRIFSQPSRLIATCRPGHIGDQKKFTLLKTAICAGASYVDIEIEWKKALRASLIQTARSAGCRVILSYHNFKKTPPRSELERIIQESFASGADIVKIACRVRSKIDNARLLGLLDLGRPLVVVGLGNRGKITRLAAPLLGSPFTYASLGPGQEVAKGQIDRDTLKKLLHRMKNV